MSDNQHQDDYDFDNEITIPATYTVPPPVRPSHDATQARTAPETETVGEWLDAITIVGSQDSLDAITIVDDHELLDAVTIVDQPELVDSVATIEEPAGVVPAAPTGGGAAVQEQPRPRPSIPSFDQPPEPSRLWEAPGKKRHRNRTVPDLGARMASARRLMAIIMIVLLVATVLLIKIFAL